MNVGENRPVGDGTLGEALVTRDPYRHADPRRRARGRADRRVSGSYRDMRLALKWRLGDDAGEDVEPAGRALRVGARRDAGGQRERLLQLDQVDAAALQHGRPLEVEAVHGVLRQRLGHRPPAAGQEAEGQAVGVAAEAEIEAGGLDLAGGRRGPFDPAAREGGLQGVVRQNPGKGRIVRKRRVGHGAS